MEGLYWFVAALAASSLFFFAVGRWLYGKGSGRGSRLVVFVSVLQGVLCLLVVGQTIAPNAAVAEGFYLLAGVLFALVPLTWFLFSLAYAYPERLTRRVWLGVGGYFVLLGSLILTNPIHRRYASEVRYVVEPFPHVQSVPTPLGLLSYVAYLLFLTGVLLLVYRLLTTLRASRGQLASLVVGLLFPAVYVPVVLLGALPGTIQGGFTGASLGYMLVGSTWPSALVAWAVYRYQLFDVIPLAREAIFEDRQEPVFVLDAEGRVMDYNRAAVEMFPAVEGHTGSSLSTLAPDLVTGDVAADDDGVGPEGGTAFVDTVTRYTGSGPREYAVGVSTLSADDEVRGYSLVLRDVTEREQYVRDLEQQTAQLERFASTLSHDLRNPLNVAQARVKMAIESGSTENLEKADQAHDRIEAMIRDLLTLAREGQTIDEVAPVRIADVLRDAWETTATRDATLAVDPDADVLVYADAVRLQNVFENLIRNSVEHGSTGRRTRSDDSVEHGSTTSRSQAHENSVEHSSTGSRPSADDSVEHGGDDVTVTLGRHPDGFYVEDDGPGVPPEDRDEVFEFGHTTAAHGTGLGLAIVESVARAHGWTVEMTAGSDGGARVAFSDVDVVDSPPEAGGAVPISR